MADLHASSTILGMVMIKLTILKVTKVKLIILKVETVKLTILKVVKVKLNVLSMVKVKLNMLWAQSLRSQQRWRRHWGPSMMLSKYITLRQSLHTAEIDDLRKSRGLHPVRAFGHGPVYIYRSMPVGVAQSRHTFVGGTVSTWGRWRIPVNKRQKRHQKCWSNIHCSGGMCRSDSRFPQLVV